MREYLPLLIAIGIGSVAFVLLWRRGVFLRVTGYVHETREELKKCTWPTVEELKGSTVVVLVSIVLLGGFTVLVDFLIALMVRLIT